MSASDTVVLLCEDDAAIRTVVSQALRRAGHAVRTVASVADLSRALSAGEVAAVVTDVVLPDGDAIVALAAMLERGATLPPVIVLSAQNTLSTAVRATEVGAFDYLPKPFDLDALVDSVAAALTAGDGGEPPVLPDEPFPLIGRSDAMQAVYRVVARVVGSDLGVLITGESGTGKELVARAIHDFGRRRASRFVAINMAAIPRELIESELFGHERGAFTGAQARSIGRFEQADGGTLFLDEIGDMPIDAQTRLLRVLQSGEFMRVGGASARRADVRIVAATNRNLAELVEQGQFRDDLYYRLNVVPIALPPLRGRGPDIGLLARHFVEASARIGLPRKLLSDSAIARLERHDWPGNVRELENVVQRLCLLERDDVIDAAAVVRMLGGAEASRVAGDDMFDVAHWVERRVATLIDAGGDGDLHARLLAEVEAPLIRAMLRRCGGNQLRAAQALGINRNTLRKRIDLLAIDLSTLAG